MSPNEELYSYALGVSAERLKKGGLVLISYSVVDCEECGTNSPCHEYAVIKTGMIHKVCLYCDALRCFKASLGTDHVCSQEALGPFKFVPVWAPPPPVRHTEIYLVECLATNIYTLYLFNLIYDKKSISFLQNIIPIGIILY